jgi:Trypsin-co-occurring domain 1
MSVLISVPLESGGVIVVEAPEELASGGVVRAARPGEIVKQASETLEEALEKSLVPVAKAVLGCLEEIGPHDVEVTLGLKLSAEAGVVISKVAGEASLAVKLTWRRGAASGT